MFRKKKLKPENLLSYPKPTHTWVDRAKIFTGALAGQMEEELNAWLSVKEPRREIKQVYFSVMDARYAQKYAALVFYVELVPIHEPTEVLNP